MKRRLLIILPFAGLGLAACQPEPQPTSALVGDTRSVVATIESVDPQTREVLLTVAGGNRQVMELGPEVKNFAQLRPGQRVNVTYREGLLAQVAQPGSDSAPSAAVASSSAAPGQLPAGSVSRTVRARVTVTEIDIARNTVAFVGPRGIPHVVAVRDPRMQALLRTLHPGSQVDLTYLEALSIKVDPIAN
jgi:hypothetical protein